MKIKLPHLFVGVSALTLALPAAAQTVNTSQVSQTGSNNQANVDNNVLGNASNSSTIKQNGFANSASVYQRQVANRSYVEQLGTFNSATHEQSGTSNNLETRQVGDFNASLGTEVGSLNAAAIAQVGYYNGSTVRQGYALDDTVPTGETRRADNNRATVDQQGAGLTSLVQQRAGSSSALAASDNVANVVQRSVGSENNVQQSSAITQESRGNSASIFQYDGSAEAANLSVITQRNSSALSADVISSNQAIVSQTGLGERSFVTQDGSQNSASVSLAGADAAGGKNGSVVSQTGTSLSAEIVVGSRASSRADSNAVNLDQQGTAHTARVYQFGFGDGASVQQSSSANSAALGSGYAFVSQNASTDQLALRQQGDNSVDVTQGFGGSSSISVAQIDAGDVGQSRSLNAVAVAQYGTGNRITIDQDSIGARAEAWQQVGSSDNSTDLRQGTGGTALSSTTATPGFLGGPIGSNTSGLSASVVQGASNNMALVYQDGANLTAQSEQFGAGTSGMNNVVFISQTGSQNFAHVYQSTNVGPSVSGDPASGNSAAQNGASGGKPAADEFYFAGGARSAEARILQTSSGNSATISQFGKGQLARIEQSGGSNLASIVQDALAVNATAVIRQQGSGNSYSVAQTGPGQYVVVTQAGQNNAVTSVVSRP